MFVQSSLLMLALASLPHGGTPKAPGYNGPYELRGQVVDVFDDGRVLLSIGKEDGARQGLKGRLWRRDPNPATVAVEFVEVGAKHSVVRFMSWLQNGGGYVDPLGLFGKKIVPLTEKDSVVWYSAEPRPQPDLPILRPGFLYGGAVIDLTTPNGLKMLPRMK